MSEIDKNWKVAEVEATFDHDKQRIYVEWSITNCGFGESSFFVKENVMYCDSEYMSKETETKVLKAVYDKYGRPDWVKEDFINGHSRIICMNPIESEFIPFLEADGDAT